MRNSLSITLIVGLALLLRLLFAAGQDTQTPYLNRSGDEYRYLKIGYDLTTERSYAEIRISNAPLYPIVVGLVLRPFLFAQTPAEIRQLHDDEVLPISLLRDTAAPIQRLRLVGALLGTALVWLIYRGTWRLSEDRRAALVAAFALAIAPAFIRETARIGTETLYLTLWLAGLVALLEAWARPNQSPQFLTLSGGAFGLATLTRQPPLLLPFFVAALWFVLLPRHQARLASALRPLFTFLASFAAVLAIWALYTTIAWGRPILVSDASITAILFRGASGGGSPQEVDARTQELTGARPAGTRPLPYGEAMLTLIREDPLGYLMNRGRGLLSAALQPHGTLHFSGPSLRAAFSDWWQSDRSAAGLLELARAPSFAGKALLWLFHLVALGAGGLGAWVLWRRRTAALAFVALASAYTYALHFFLEVNARYLFPQEPLWWMLAGVGLVALGEWVAAGVKIIGNSLAHQ